VSIGGIVGWSRDDRLMQGDHAVQRRVHRNTDDRVWIGSLLTTVEDGSDIIHERVGLHPKCSRPSVI